MGSYDPPKYENFKTSLYQKKYFHRIMHETTPGRPSDKHGIFLEVLAEEKAFLDGMGKEYDEITAAAEIMEAIERESGSGAD